MLSELNLLSTIDSVPYVLSELYLLGNIDSVSYVLSADLKLARVLR